MNQADIDEQVRLCLRNCLHAAQLPADLSRTIYKIIFPSIRDLIGLFIEAAERNCRKPKSMMFSEPE